MTFFICCKQIVDMLYQIPILDYFMLMYAIIIFIYKFTSNKVYDNLFSKLIFLDYIVILLAFLYGYSFLRNTLYYRNFIKIESGFLLYFIGRFYGKKLFEKKGNWLAITGYIVIYANFIYRFYLFGFRLFLSPGEEGLLNSGGLYYYKTDLALGILYALVFVYLYSNVTWLKWITVFVTSGYMILYSYARMEQVVLWAIWLMMILFRFGSKDQQNTRIKLAPLFIIIATIISLIFIILQIYPLEELQNTTLKDNHDFLEKIFHGRHVIWMDLLIYFKNCSFPTRFWGIDLGSELHHTTTDMRAHSQYIKQLYSIGYIGCYTWGFLLAELISCYKNTGKEKMTFLFIVSWFIFIFAGISTESIEFTQISWCPLLLLGAMATRLAEKNKSTNSEG